MIGAQGQLHWPSLSSSCNHDLLEDNFSRQGHLAAKTPPVLLLLCPYEGSICRQGR